MLGEELITEDKKVSGKEGTLYYQVTIFLQVLALVYTLRFWRIFKILLLLSSLFEKCVVKRIKQSK